VQAVIAQRESRRFVAPFKIPQRHKFPSWLFRANPCFTLILKTYRAAALLAALPSNLIRQLAQFFADALGLGFVIMHNGILKQQIKALDRLNSVVSLRHRHSLYSTTL
jgi:hypothetical protein